MVKLIFCLHRRSDLSHQQFLDHWYLRHAPLVRQHAKAIGLLRYVQSHGLAHPIDELLRRSRGGPAGYDGVAELYYESAEALHQAMYAAAARAAGQVLLADERQFIDLARSPLFVCEERLIHADAAVDVERLAGDVGRIRPEQE